MDDIVPELLATIEKQFANRVSTSKKLGKSIQRMQDGTASYLDANDYAIEIGEILSNVFKNNVSSDVLPDGKMYYNIADRILNKTLKKNYDLIANYSEEIQKSLNQQANIGLKVQTPDLNQDRIDGLVNRVSAQDIYDDVKWMLDEPIVNFSQSIVDDSIKINADFHAKAGLRPKLIRRAEGKACKWCRSLAGSYDYNNAPDDIYRRHQRCRCTVDYDPGNGRKQDVWSKQWSNPTPPEIIEQRKNIGLPMEKSTGKPFDLLPITGDTLSNRDNIQEIISRTKSVVSEYKEKTGIDVVNLWKNKKFSDRNNSYNDEKAKFMSFILEKTGYNSKPVKLTSTEGLTQLFRGVVDFEDGSVTAKELVKAFKEGRYYSSGDGQSAHGRGIYFFYDEAQLSKILNKAEKTNKNGEVITAYITSDAKILDETLINQMRSYFSEIKDTLGDEDRIYYEFLLNKNSLMDKQNDLFAIMYGYDGLSAKSIATIFNRGKLGVKA